jgi:hypothetical protein
MSILEHAARTARYSTAEVAALDFEGGPPDAGGMSRRWKTVLEEARTVVGLLPAEQVGTCIITEAGTLYDGTAEQLGSALAQRAVRFHAGLVGGALPALRA